MELLTQINETNINYYAPLIPMSVLEYAAKDATTEILGIEAFQTAAGAIVFSLDGSDVNIVWLGLSEEFQGMGIMYRCFYDFLDLMAQSGMKHIRATLHAGCDVRARRLLHEYAFDYSDARQATWYCTLKELRTKKIFKTESRHCISLREADEFMLRKLSAAVREDHMAYVDLPLEAKDYAACSSIYIRDNEPKAVMLVKENAGRLYIAYMYSKENQPQAMIELMAHTLGACDDYDEAMQVTTGVVNPAVIKLVERLECGRLERSKNAVLAF